jgi:hypothetical protein
VNLAEWRGRAADDPTEARDAAARSILDELETHWHVNKGPLPGARLTEISQNAEATEQYRKTLRAWRGWAEENPIASERFFEERTLIRR